MRSRAPLAYRERMPCVVDDALRRDREWKQKEQEMQRTKEEQEKADAELQAFNDQIRGRQQRELDAARGKQFHERTPAERDAVHYAELQEHTKRAHTPPPRTREERLAEEACHNAVVDWRASEPTYSGSTEDAAHVWAAMNTLHLPQTAAGFAQAFAYCVKNKMCTPVAQQPRQPTTPLEHARARGWTKSMIVNTPKAKLRELIKDKFTEQMIDAVLAAPGE
jgi:hypothetical protein